MSVFKTISKETGQHHPTLIQPSLEIGKEDDDQEKEANHVADQVMRMPDKNEKVERMRESPAILPKMNGSPAILPKMGEADEEEPIRKKSEEPLNIQKKSQGDGGGMTASKNVEQGISNSKGNGQSLPADTQQELGTKMGADLSGVNIHTDSKAVQMNKEVGAKAFTHGKDIYFNQGQYDPSSNEGKHLLAHELTHTVQQGSKVNKKIQRQNIPGTVFGSIDPTRLKFVQIVPYSPPTGGWQAVSVIVSFVYESWSGLFTNSFYRRQEINMEIGVPIKNHTGTISVAYAQTSAVQAMDMAAEVVGESGELGTPAAITTMRFWTQLYLSTLIPGATVSAPVTKKLIPIRL
jgi:hypothetical protein